MPENKTKKRWVGIGLGCGLLILVILIGLGVFLYAGWLGYQETPKQVEVQKSNVQLEDPYQLSTEQEDQLFTYGYPEAFTILFYEEETISGTLQTIRLETWDYYTQGIGLTFINGELIAEDPIELGEIVTLDPLQYYPEQFSAFMSLDEVIAAAGIDNYVEVPLEKEFIDSGISYFAHGLSFGLKNDQLMYIEALAITND
jgi:hypothetical protein